MMVLSIKMKWRILHTGTVKGLPQNFEEFEDEVERADDGGGDAWEGAVINPLCLRTQQPGPSGTSLGLSRLVINFTCRMSVQYIRGNQ